MRLLFIDGDDDFHFLTFENQNKYSVQEIVSICEGKTTKEHRFEVDKNHFDAKLYEFGEVDKAFIDFLMSKKDYDDAKHSNWIIVD